MRETKYQGESDGYTVGRVLYNEDGRQDDRDRAAEKKEGKMRKLQSLLQ